MKTKTSISIDQQVWTKLKNLAVERGVDISSLLQIAIEDELISNFEDSIMKFSTKGGTELDFDPIEPRQNISGLVSGMRDEREDRISGQ